MSLSFVIVTFKSNHLIDNLIKSIPDKYDILIIENSLDTRLKKKLESNFKNVKVYIPDENLGYSQGLNYGVKEAKNKFVFCLVADVFFKKETFFSIEKICEEIENFAIIAPTYKNENTYKNYVEIKNSEQNIIEIKNKKLLEVREVDGAAFVINREKFDTNIMDEKIFMYFESTDMCLNTFKKGEKIYAILDVKFEHLGLQSSEAKYSDEIKKIEIGIIVGRNFTFIKKTIIISTP